MNDAYWVAIGCVAIAASYVGACWGAWTMGRSFERWRIAKELKEIKPERFPVIWTVHHDTEATACVHSRLKQ